MNTRLRRPLDASPQQRADRHDSRQQQQDNGTHEFQPAAQQGDVQAPDDSAHTLEAYLQRARSLGELPVAPPATDDVRRPPDLRLAK